MTSIPKPVLIAALLALLSAAAACAPAQGERILTVYSGRSESLVGPLLERFGAESGIKVQARYGSTAEVAATLLEEGENSPADVFLAQDAGALGAIAQAGRFAPLPQDLLNKVNARFRSPDGLWLGVSGRARVVAYDTRILKEADLPEGLDGFTDPKWKDKIGWAPQNASFQAFVTALRITQGEDAARQWLTAVRDNGARSYPNNVSVVDAVGRGEIQVGFVNHYYLYEFIKERGQDYPVRNYHPRDGSAGAMINVAGIGILSTSKHAEEARDFIAYLLSPAGQQYFAEQTFEYPLVDGIPTSFDLPPLSEIHAPDLDLGSISDLQGTLSLLRDLGLL